MIAAAALAAWLSMPWTNVPDAYERAMEAVAQGRYAAALDQARAVEDPLLRAQATVYACFRGRDYAGALRAAEAGLAVPERAPADERPARVWLADRAAAAASYFEATGALARALDRLAELVAGLPAGREHDEWEDAVEAHREALDALLAAEAERARAVQRARVVALATALSATLFGLFLLRRAGAQVTSVQSSP